METAEIRRRIAEYTYRTLYWGQNRVPPGVRSVIGVCLHGWRGLRVSADSGFLDVAARNRVRRIGYPACAQENRCLDRAAAAASGVGSEVTSLV